MFDKELVLNELLNIETSINSISKWTCDVKVADDFALTQSGVILLNAVCMQLIAIGEELKKIDKRTNKDFLKNYKDIDWQEIMKNRDFVAHHYFDIDFGIVFDTIKNDLPVLKKTILKMKNDLK